MAFIGQPAGLYDRNNPDWAPAQNMGHKKIKCQTNADVSRAVRAKERAEKRKRSEAANVLLQISQELSIKVKGCSFFVLEIYNLCRFDYLACVSIELHIL